MKTKDENLPSRKKRFWQALAYLFVGLLTTVILAGIKSAIEHTPDGKQSEIPLFGFLQRVALPDFDAENPVVVIDISHLSDHSEELAPILKEIIDALKTVHKRPIAIAVDVDFSPTGALSSNVTEFFNACLKKQPDDVPVFLAVGDNKSASPEERLGLEEYKDLAAAVAINKDDTKWIPIWVRANQGEELKTLSFSLALEYPGELPGPPSWIAKAVEVGNEGGAVTRERGEVDPNEVALTYGERLVNYSKLETIKSNAKAVRDREEAKSIKNDSTTYAGKLVIIGDVARAMDQFQVPIHRNPEPGSLLLASSTYTLIKEPLFEFKPRVKRWLDLIIAGLIVFPVAIIRYKKPSTSLYGLQAVFIYVAILLVLAAGLLLVRYGQVIWPDFFFVLGALALHPKVERILHPLLNLLVKLFRKLKPKQSPPAATGPVASAIVLITIALITTKSLQAQQQPADLCGRGVGVIAVEIKRASKAKKTKETCQYCEKDKDCYKDPWHDILERDLWKPFQAGEKLRCSKPCTLTIFVCGTGRTQPIKYIEGEKGPGWFTVINAYRIPRKILDKYKETPAKTIKWSAYLAPANPDPRNVALNAAMMTPLFSESARLAGRTAVRPTSPGSIGAKPSATPGPTSRGERTASAGSTGTSATAEASRAEKRKLFDKLTSLLISGNAARDAKNYAAATEAYSEASVLIPSDPRSYSGLGNVHFDQQQWAEAETSYRQATLLGAYSSAEVYLALATVLINLQEIMVDKDRLKEAENYLWTAAILDRRNERIYTLLDLALRKRGAEKDELETAYRRALRINSESVGTNLRLSILLRTSGRKDEAKEHLKIAEKLARTPDQLLDVAEELESRRKLDKAQRFARRALKLDEKNARAYLILGLVKIDREKYAAALPLLEDAIKYKPDDFVARYLSAITHLETGDLDQSERLFDEAIARMSSEPESDATSYWLTVLGDSYVEKGRKADAVRVFEKVLKQNPDDVETLNKITRMRSAVAP